MDVFQRAKSLKNFLFIGLNKVNEDFQSIWRCFNEANLCNSGHIEDKPEREISRLF